MARTKRRGARLALGLLGLLLLVGAIGGAVLASGVLDRHPAYLDLPRAAAARIDLFGSVRAGGEVDSAQRTLIECELENLRVSSGLSSTKASGSSTIIDMVDDGTMVDEGEVICRLDSSEYEELVRQHELLVFQARADEEKARLDLKAAEIALREYRDGQLEQLQQDYQSQIVLHEADIRRQVERLAWADRMVAIGYLSSGQRIQEAQALKRSRIELARVKGAQAKLDRYSAPIQIKRLESAVARAREELTYQRMRVLNREEQLAKFQAQVDACTIRAPHPGMVIYANEPDDDPRVELGAVVRRKMDLFYLPDLGRMEVLTLLHESVVNRVKPGQSALIRVNGLPGLTLEGHVKSIAPLPITPKNWRTPQEIKNFLARVVFHTVPPHLLPGMTAEVEIQTDRRPRALVVPCSAVTIEDGREVLYVAGDDGLERRVVDVRPGDVQFVEVRSGVAEGEEVILDPDRITPDDALAARTTEGPAGPDEPPALSAEVAQGGFATR
jgi:HlyD family secretion protein